MIFLKNSNLFSNEIDSFFLDCEIKNISTPKMITNPKIDKE